MTLEYSITTTLDSQSVTKSARIEGLDFNYVEKYLEILVKELEKDA